MADVVKTCANCGNAQAAGAFCERCGTRLPDVSAEPTSAAAAAPAPVAVPVAAPAEVPPAVQAPAYQVQPPQGAQQAGGYQQGAYTQAPPPPYQYATQPQYAAPKGPNPLEKLFDLSFQGYVTRGSIKVLWVSSLILIGAFFLLSLIFFAIAADRFDAYWCIGIFSTLVLLPLLIGWTRIILELTTTVAKIRDDYEKAAEAKATGAQVDQAKGAEAKAAKTKS